MPTVQTNLSSIFKRFPGQRETIERLSRESDSFRTICEDYLRCADARRYWEQSSSEDAAERREEYASLLRELEAEIIENLKVIKETSR